MEVREKEHTVKWGDKRKGSGKWVRYHSRNGTARTLPQPEPLADAAASSEPLPFLNLEQCAPEQPSSGQRPVGQVQNPGYRE